jgi:hypothetical protein
VLDHRAPTAALPELPERRAFERTGRSAVERLAVLAVARDVSAMPASMVAQLALWPDDLAHWARASASPSRSSTTPSRRASRTRACASSSRGVSTCRSAS